MQTKHIIRSVLAFSILVQVAKAQDIHFSQYAETPSSINPALAGVTYNTRITGNFKNQWSTVATKYQTFGVSFDQTIKHKKLKSSYFAVAVNIFRDVAGDAKLSTTNPNLGIAYIQRISKKMKFSGGVQSGFFYRTLDASNLRFDRQYDGYNYNPNLSSGETPTKSGISSFDLGGGVNLNYVQSDKFISAKNSAKFDLGFSAYHYRLGKTSFLNSNDRLQTRMCAYFNGDFNIRNSLNAIMPSILYMKQGTLDELVAGALFKFIIGDQSTYTSLKKARAFSLGGYYRFGDAIIPTILFQYNKYAFGVSYDINVSALSPASNKRGGIEIMLRYNIFPGYGVNLGRTDTKPSY
ncbi:PorP/SprF family type IX secretion system membrane protein [Aurantibacillus circumpalustris]|uniref:PorP/SprF family type IX secretion system membrane protein n=1 Tax=Aurantibacillus circumpalustris TaxID=3036359 RepID=UPI00295ADA93|nr:PorP/SprF family type IX secretion system membrane protein [Aurantibacillus circumpalustris]